MFLTTYSKFPVIRTPKIHNVMQFKRIGDITLHTLYFMSTVLFSSVQPQLVRITGASLYTIYHIPLQTKTEFFGTKYTVSNFQQKNKSNIL